MTDIGKPFFPPPKPQACDNPPAKITDAVPVNKFQCKVCGKLYDRTSENFGKNDLSKDGLDVVCNVCIQSKPKEKLEKFQCKKCGIYLDRTKENFSPHAKTKDGLNTTCRECMSKAMREGQRRRAEKNKPSKAPAMKNPHTEPVENIQKKPESTKLSPQPFRREINFADHTEVMDAIEKLAKQNIRSFAGQVVFMLRDAVEAEHHRLDAAGFHVPAERDPIPFKGFDA